MFTSFSTALSALKADSTAIDVVGNNLANLNSTGYKTNVVSFHDLVTESLAVGNGETQVGFGVGRPTTSREFTQGALQSTGGTLDAAIQGDGFFLVRGTDGSTQYTRAGNFQVDKNGTLVTATGEKVQGWSQTNGVVDTNGATGNITVPTGTINAPVSTTAFSLDLNLNAAATAGPPADTFSTAVQVFDSLGESHIMTAKFTKNAAAGQWDYSITVPDADLKAAFTPITGSLKFDAQGKLVTPAVADPATAVKITGLADGAADLTVNWNVYNGAIPRLTQYAQPSTISAVNQDGSASAQLVRVGIGDGGKVVALFSNGQQATVGQLAMASIRNPESMIAAGNNNFIASGTTAGPAIGTPGTGGRGGVVGGAVESSNVDIAREFTNLIVLQRGYQANAKIVTTVDQLSQDTINLIR